MMMMMKHKFGVNGTRLALALANLLTPDGRKSLMMN